MFASTHKIILATLVAVTAQAGESEPLGYDGSMENLHVYLLIGQSNMGGRATIEEKCKLFPKSVYLLNSQNEFEPATHPLNQYSTIGKPLPKQKLNIGYSFAIKMREARPDIAIGLIVNARGGSGIEHWMKGTEYYTEAIRRAKAAKKQGILKGILWHQGERNSGEPEGYDVKLAKLIEDFREDLGDDSLPFVAGQIVEKPGTERINALIAELPNQVPNTGYVSSKGLTSFEKWHFDAPSLIALGEGYAREMIQLHGGTVSPVDLRCEGQDKPIATPPRPRLSWSLQAAAGTRGQEQSAWQILVASSPDKLTEADADLWDSGKTSAKRSPHIRYGGTPLQAGQVSYWKVRSWNGEDQASAWSETSKWEVALTHPEDWRGARWIDDGKDNPSKDKDFYQPDPAPLLRREFKLSKPVSRARLHVAGLGLGYPSLNGERLVDHVFDPQWTNFDKRILYRTLDVTDRLEKGTNCIGLELGNGWYNPLPLRMWGNLNLREALPVGRPRAIACLVVDHPDGSQSTIVSGPDWKTIEGPTIRNNIYLGEVRDARKERPGWNQTSYDDSAWKPVRVRDYPLKPLQPLLAPPVRLTESFQAETVSSPKDGVYIVDFGRNFTGLPEIELDLPAGTEVRFRFGELLHADGSLNPLSSVCGQIKGTKKLNDGTVQSIGGPGAPEIAWQQDVYIARGGGETYRPDFTFHGFRYMEITGLSEASNLANICGYPMRSDLRTKGAFTCSNEQLNQIQQVTRHTFLANVMTVQSDCPHRERFAYGGDIVATSDAFLMNFDMAGFYAKTVHDWADAVLPDGRLTDTAPSIGLDYCGVGWAKVHPLLLEQLHQYYGASDLIEKQLPVAMGWLDAEAARRENHLVVTGLGDHEALVDKQWGVKLTTPLFIDAALRISRLAEIAGEAEIASRAKRYADESLQAWKDNFYDNASGIIAEGTQSQLTFALGLTHLSAAEKEKLFGQLVNNLTAPDDGPRLSTGIFGTRILMEELSKRGRSDLAYGLATRESFPSWNYMLANGATTLWERWQKDDGRYSHNHPMFGSISGWFYRWLGGIQPAADAIGFDRFHIRPQVLTDLEWVKTSYDSVRGRIVSNWSTGPNVTLYEIIIPPDTSALVELPIRAGDEVTERGNHLSQAEGIKVLPAQSPNTLSMKVGSGHYQFRVTHNYNPH